MRAIDRYTLPDAPLCYAEGSSLSAAHFLGQAFALADRLPDLPYAVNICADRRSFMAGFIAAMIRGQTTLMPGDTAPETLRHLAAAYEGVHYLHDGASTLPDGASSMRLDPTLSADAVDPADAPSFDPDRIATVAFTSGSTGRPTSHEKTWGSLVINARLAARRFSPHAVPNIVATAPQQHMYGFETSVMLPLQNGGATFAGRPFFPEDVARALATIPAPRILVTTPIHLRALLAADVDLPPLATVISATAPLPRELASAFEKRHGAAVQEIFGCTEAGSIASRRTVEGDVWTPYDGVTMTDEGDRIVVNGGHLTTPTPLADRFELTGDGGFIHRGRAEDMVNIGGKRTSLGYLNARLMEIDGVSDGAFLLVKGEEQEGIVARLAACVVTELTKESLLNALRQKIDPIFLPRPLTIVADLHRNANGKISHQRLLSLLQGGVA